MASRTTAKAFIGSEIRRAREARGISRAKLAKPLMVSESLIVAWESGRVGVLPEHMKRMLGIDPNCDTYNQPLLEFTPEFIIRMVEQLTNGEAAPEWEGKWLVAEELTTCIYSFETTIIYGLLQCPEYMQTVHSSEESVKKRLERQQRFLIESARTRLVAVMDESVLHRNVGGPDIMARQLAFLIECAERENILMHIVPMASAVCAKFRRPFLIATLDNRHEIAYVDDAISGGVVEHPEDVAVLRERFDQYRAEALRKSESVDLMRKAMEKWMP